MSDKQTVCCCDEYSTSIANMSYRNKIIFIGAMSVILFLITIVTLKWAGPYISRKLSTPGFIGYFLVGIFEALCALIYASLSTRETRKLMKAFSDFVWNSFAMLGASITVSSAIFAPIAYSQRSNLETMNSLSIFKSYPDLFGLFVTAFMFAASTKLGISAHDLFTSSPRSFFHVAVATKRR